MYMLFFFDQLMLRIFTGAHTVGVADCQFFVDRLYNFLGTGLPIPTWTQLMAITSATFVRKQLTPRTQLRVATCRWTSGHSLDGTGATSGTWNRGEDCSASTTKLGLIPRLVPISTESPHQISFSTSRSSTLSRKWAKSVSSLTLHLETSEKFARSQ